MVATVQNPKLEEKQQGRAALPAVHMKYVDTLPAQLGEQNPAGFVRYAVEILNYARTQRRTLQPGPDSRCPDDRSARTAWLQRSRRTACCSPGRGPAVPEAPPGLTYRYRVMRSPAGANAYIALADIEPEAEGFYLDKTFAWETKYDYRITSVTLVHSQGINMTVEGDDSKPVQTFTRDIYPPGAAHRTASRILQRRTKALCRPDLGAQHGKRSWRIQRLPPRRGRRSREAESTTCASAILPR